MVVSEPPPAPDGQQEPIDDTNPATPAAIHVTGVAYQNSTASRGYMRYRISWPQSTATEELMFDARRVLLLTLSGEKAGCYLTIPLSSDLSRDPADEPRTRRLELYEKSERGFAQQLQTEVGAPVDSAEICEAVGARVKARTPNLSYRAARCSGQDFQAIDETDWKKIADATAASNIKLGVMKGHPQKPETDLELVKSGLRDGHLCSSAPDVPIEKKIMLGLRWLNGA
jgi:hypothetical protein